MKKIIFCLIYFFINAQLPFCQIIHSSKIDSILNLVSVQSISKINRELSGDTIVTIGGIPQTLISRAWNSQGNIKAAQYIFEKFQSYNLTPKYMVTTVTNLNVYAVKTGTLYPNKKIIIGAHYDDLLYDPNPSPSDTMHGADDNASGICGVLEAARLLSGMSLPFTVIFVAFDEEEAPMILSGSKAFADSCFARNDSIIAMLNLDMIGWDGNNDNKFAVLSDSNSYSLHRVLYNCLQSYQIDLHFFQIYNEHWDEGSFQNHGYKAISVAEEARYYFNPYYHTINDSFDKFNIQFFQKMIKAAIATIMTYALNMQIEMYHIPLISTTNTTSRNAQVHISFPNKIATGLNAPRLYYRVNNGNYNYVNPYSVAGDEYFFTIPGFPVGTKISYYIAAQDSTGSLIFTLPSGGSGINPPGTVPPQNNYVYYILSSLNIYSNSTPKNIYDLQIIKDTIHISQTGNIVKINVILNINHSNDGDLFIKLVSDIKNSILTQYNGENGQNFTNTIFDDTAYNSIAQGNPPFTGRFRPQSVLSAFNNSQTSGDWILVIYDKSAGNQGTLLNWGLQIVYENTIGINNISKNIPEKIGLFQNYPNPFNPKTKIRFDIPNPCNVRLEVFDITGKNIFHLVNEYLREGSYDVDFDGTSLSSGIYFYRLTAGNFVNTKKMIILK